MSLASWRAVAKTATAAPLRRATRRKEAPRADLERWRAEAAVRSTPATRLAPRPLRRFVRGLPPEMEVRGQSRSQETKSSSEGNAARFGPTSVKTTLATPALMPSMRVRSTPVAGHLVLDQAPRGVGQVDLSGLAHLFEPRGEVGVQP